MATDLRTTALAAEAAIAALILASKGRTWPEDERTLQSALSLAQDLANIGRNTSSHC